MLGESPCSGLDCLEKARLIITAFYQLLLCRTLVYLELNCFRSALEPQTAPSLLAAAVATIIAKALLK